MNQSCFHQQRSLLEGDHDRMVPLCVITRQCPQGLLQKLFHIDVDRSDHQGRQLRREPERRSLMIIAVMKQLLYNLEPLPGVEPESRPYKSLASPQCFRGS